MGGNEGWYVGGGEGRDERGLRESRKRGGRGVL